MNNGDNTIQTNNNQPSLEMAGVKIAPPQETPITNPTAINTPPVVQPNVVGQPIPQLPTTPVVAQASQPVPQAPVTQQNTAVVQTSPQQTPLNQPPQPVTTLPNMVDPLALPANFPVEEKKEETTIPAPTSEAPIEEPTPSVPVISAPVETPQPETPPVKEETQVEPVVQEPPKQPELPPVKETPTPTKKGINIIPLLILIITGLGIYSVYITKDTKAKINQISYNCTPVKTQEQKELDIKSTLVQDLYNKVYTTIREDYANPYLDNQMKLYLAYRQITEKEKYDSNCNSFSVTAMEPYTCEMSANFTPKAFKEDTLKREFKKLFGENTYFEIDNIQLGNSCIIGYQYIKERKEFVEGYCNKKVALSFKAEKTLVSATSTGNTIILTEEVKYKAGENLDLPNYLKSGTYRYTFRLDKNYNYVLISKTHETQY